MRAAQPLRRLQAYLAYEKLPPPLGPLEGPRGGVGGYERDTPVPLNTESFLCRVKMPHVMQPRPHSGIWFQVEVLYTLHYVPSSLASEILT